MPKEIDVRKRRNNYLLTKYGITLDEYEKRFKDQGEACICGRKAKEGKNLALDHNHLTGEARGCLCYVCNNKVVGPLEKYNKDPYRISLLLVKYFEKWGTKDLNPGHIESLKTTKGDK